MKLELKKMHEVDPYCYTYKITERIRLYIEYSTYSKDNRLERIYVQKKHKDAWWYNKSEFNVMI